MGVGALGALMASAALQLPGRKAFDEGPDGTSALASPTAVLDDVDPLTGGPSAGLGPLSAAGARAFKPDGPGAVGPAWPGASAPPPLREPALAQSSDLQEFYFTRVAYSGGGGRGFRRRQSWSTDYPKSDRQFLTVLKRLTNLDAFDEEHPLLLTDPNLRRFPFLYAVEVGYMSMTQAEVTALRDFLLSGGFLVVDDFWGTYEWRNLEYEMQKVFPEFPIIDLPLEHEIFHTFYDIEEILQVPALGRGIGGAPTWERDGYDPAARGIFDDQGRLMVVINWNTDLGDAWEWAENPYYPLKFSTFAYQMGVNFIVYAMSH